MTTRPSTPAGAHLGLEVYLTGTARELDAATQALAGLGRLHPGRTATPLPGRTATPLPGADKGRYRKYLRVTIAIAVTQPGTPDSPSAAGPTLFDAA
jgi:hypothetical protein